jgi:L-ascorbate metabolism protein UlaG (beta-lactamase superfamily)
VQLRIVDDKTMKYIFSSITILLMSVGLLPLCKVDPIYAQGFTLEQIRVNLINNPPKTGDPLLREQTILALDEILKHDSSRTSSKVLNFYNLMMEKVDTELEVTVSIGASIWMMYNHGFLVKTPQVVIAFDLVNGYYGWSTNLPTDLIEQINILFISHTHGDHYNYSLANTVMANGGFVVFPSESSPSIGNVPMAAGDSLTILGLRIKAHDGLHSVPIRIFEVTTHDAINLFHTGDNQTSTTLPPVDSSDLLLLNAWVNESGHTSAVIGMRNCINKLNPTVMIPGHIQELGHNYTPGNPTSRVPYEWAFEVDDVPLNSQVQVMAWGERLFVSGEPVGITEHRKNLSTSQSITLHQNYPNPFNPSTTIEFSLPHTEFVTLEIYNVLGKEVATLVSEKVPAGGHKYNWNASGLASGIYLYQLKTQSFIETKKLVLLK